MNRVETVDGPAITRRMALAYLNCGNHSSDGIANLQREAVVKAGLTDLACLYAGTTDAVYVA